MKFKPIYLTGSCISLTLPLATVSCFEKNYKENFDKSVAEMDKFLLEIKDQKEYKSFYNVYNLFLNNIKENYVRAVQSGEEIQQGIYKAIAAQISALTLEARKIINKLSDIDKTSDKYISEKANYQDLLFNVYMYQIPLNNIFYVSFTRIYTPTENKNNPSLVEKLTWKIKELKDSNLDDKQYSLLLGATVKLYSEVLLEELDKINFNLTENEYHKWSEILNKKYEQFNQIYNKLLNNEEINLENKQIWKLDYEENYVT